MLLLTPQRLEPQPMPWGRMTAYPSITFSSGQRRESKKVMEECPTIQDPAGLNHADIGLRALPRLKI